DTIGAGQEEPAAVSLVSQPAPVSLSPFVRFVSLNDRFHIVALSRINVHVHLRTTPCRRLGQRRLLARCQFQVKAPNSSKIDLMVCIENFSEKFLLPEDFINAAEKPVDIPTDAILDAVQNSQLFEGDIIGMPSIDEPTLRRLRDDPLDAEEARIFGT
ncbi:hypothetical protein OSTOST_21202, partial [Ostertagia ostertagi]